MSAESCLYWREKGSGWRVIIICRGRRYEKIFSIRRHGSREKAHQAALEWRNQLRATLPRRRVMVRHSRNRSGKVGVGLQCKTNPSGEQYWSWMAQWRLDGCHHSKKFSILKYGEAVAYQLAVHARDMGIAGEHNDGKRPLAKTKRSTTK